MAELEDNGFANRWNARILRHDHDGFIYYHCVRTPTSPVYLAFMPYLPTLYKFTLEAVLSGVESNLIASPALFDMDSSPQPPDAIYISPYLQKTCNSNQRTRNQFRPRNATKGTTSYQLRQYAEATLGGGSLRKIVKLPEGEDENEWLAVNSELFI